MTDQTAADTTLDTDTAVGCEQSADEFADTLTGFDEIAIKKAFGIPFSSLAPDEKGSRGDAFQFLRCLIFVHRRRQGDNDITAYNAAQNLVMGDVVHYFADEDEESGKDNSTPE